MQGLPQGDEEEARVTVMVVSASGLNNKLIGSGERLYQVLVGLDVNKMLGKTREQGPEPCWRQSFQLTPSSPLEELRVQVFGRDGDHYTFLGQTVVSLLSLSGVGTAKKGGGELSALFALSARSGESGITGEIQLRVHYAYPASWACVYEGVDAYERGDFAAAIDFFSTAIKRFPNEYLLFGFRSAALTDAIRYTQAHADASRVIELHPNRAEGYLRLGNVLVACDDFVKAKEAYLTALKLEPNHELTVEALGEMDRKRKLSHLKKAVSDGRTAFSKKAFEQAAQLFTEALELNPKNVSYLVYRSLCHLADGNLTKALEDAREVVRVDSNYPRDEPLMTGYMQKKGQGVTGWKSRFFVLRERFLFYYRSHLDAVPIDVVVVTPGAVVSKTRDESKFILEIPTRKYRFRCSSDRERGEWIDILSSVASQPVTIPQYDKEKLVFARDGAGSTSLPKAKVVASQPHSAGTVRTISLVDITHSGWLYKTGRINTAAKQRWFVVRDRSLFYFTKKEVTNEAQYYGSIPLVGSQLSVTGSADSTSFAVIAPDRIWNLRAQSAAEAKVWIDVLREQILGTVARLDDEAEETPEQVEAKRNFTRALSNPRASVAIVAPPPSRAGGLGVEQLGTSLEYTYTGSTAASVTHSNASSWGSSLESRNQGSAARYFERVGLAPPSEEEDGLDDIEDEGALLLGNAARGSMTVGGANSSGPGVASVTSARRGKLKGEDLERGEREAEAEEGCCAECCMVQ